VKSGDTGAEPYPCRVAAVETVDSYIQQLPGETRRLAHGEWGITVAAEQAIGWPLDVGVRVEEGVLRVQAFALAASDDINPWNFLHWNRGTRYIRFACTRAGDIWVHADLPVAAVDERTLDRVLGLVVEGAVLARDTMRSAS
jgi:putative sensory transduction regulator